MKKKSKIEQWPLWVHICVTWGGTAIVATGILAYTLLR